jgi:hypothetical protein
MIFSSDVSPRQLASPVRRRAAIHPSRLPDELLDIRQVQSYGMATARFTDGNLLVAGSSLGGGAQQAIPGVLPRGHEGHVGLCPTQVPCPAAVMVSRLGCLEASQALTPGN